MYTYGLNCLNTCGYCKDNASCDPVDGVCSNGCAPGYQTDKCDTACNSSFYGAGCSQQCGYCLGGQSCDHIDGRCPGDCEDGYQQPKCRKDCTNGTYGTNCAQTCGACKNGMACELISGVCPDSCEPGWTGLMCKTECNVGFFGQDCTGICNCRNNTACDKVSGACPNGECEAGWNGSTCSDSCDSWWHGQDCAMRCGYCYRDAICNPVTGMCPNGLCSNGWTGTTCTEACPPTRYGEGCLSLCSENCVNQECDRFNSTCTSGCVTGYQGHSCSDPVVVTTPDDYWREQTKLVLYIIAGILFLMAFLVVLCCLRRRTLKERKRVPRAFGIEEHAIRVGASVPYQDITAEANGDTGSPNIAETPLVDVATDDEAALVDNQLDAVEEEPEPVPPPTEILVEKEERDADVDTENDNDEDYPDGDVGKSDVGGTGSESATAGLAATPAATSGTDGTSDLPTAMTYGFVLPEIVGTRILLSGFVTTVKNRKECGNLANEFKNLPEGAKLPVEVGKKPENKSKNRFRNILPYDHSRVVLEKDGGGNDYINASYIDGIDSERQYIATQGPKDDTVADFWQMIWENNTGKVIMLANLIELGRPKCHQYWPNVSESSQFGSYVVKTVSEKEGKCFSVREIQLHRAQDETMTRTIQQLHFTTWPDHGTPTVEQLLSFHSSSSNIQTPLQGPEVVHCSAGVGRTGTYIALDALTKHGRYAASLDVYEYTLKMRKDRMNMIQTVQQYICLHEALAEGLPNATG
ncbi:scavenger receptor class F member 1-like [Pecten maximus]|uniref:scavenger receptor class F member 1-like n=1 Tax=Pecten maximus TaxID=6579 RepID=UPI0014580BCE|nr:scavenger receptor class F member 1-like [Pecten maximus]